MQIAKARYGLTEEGLIYDCINQKGKTQNLSQLDEHSCKYLLAFTQFIPPNRNKNI